MSSRKQIGQLYITKVDSRLVQTGFSFMTYEFHYYRFVPLSVQFMADLNIDWVYWYL